MRLIAVSRVLNEDDIIEAFLRHHAPVVDHHILLDNGSSDRTIEILQALKQEGLPLTVLQNRSVMFSEVQFNTQLFRQAARMGANWVLFLDCDEFLDERRVPGGLHARLAQLGADEACLDLPAASYQPMPTDDASELIVPLRIRWREPKLADVFKLCIRGELAERGVEISGGSHSASWRDATLAASLAPDLPLAHYYRRSAWQVVTKSVVGWLKVLAAGHEAIEGKANYHYAGMFETIRTDPAAVLLNPDFVDYAPAPADMVDDPIQYAGGPLRYTRPSDPRMKSIAVIAAYAEALARQHGQLLDSNVAARMVVENMAAQWIPIA